MTSIKSAGRPSNVNKNILSSVRSAASSAYKNLKALLSKVANRKGNHQKVNPSILKTNTNNFVETKESPSSINSFGSLDTINGDVSLKSFPEQLKDFIESGGATKGYSLSNFEIPEMENKEDVKTFMNDMITVQKIQMNDVEINTEEYNQLDTELKFLDYLNSKQFGPEELQDYLSLDNAKLDAENPEMAGIKDDLFSQLEIALKTANNAAIELNLSFDTDTLRSIKTQEIEKKLKECLDNGDSPAKLGEKLRKPDGKKDDFGFQKLLVDMYENTNKDIKHNVASKAVKNAMKSMKGQVLDEHGKNEKYQNISQQFELPSGASIKTTTEQQTDDFVSSATHASNPNNIGNLHLETNEITVKDNTGNDKTVTKKTLRHGAINTHHLKGDAQLNGFGKLDYSASNLEELTNFIRDDLQSPDQKSVTKGQGALKKLGISENQVKTWTALKTGGSNINKNLLKKKLNKKLALRNKAIDLAKAAFKAAPSGKKSITINSFSLLTPDTPRDIKASIDGGHSEKQALKEQLEAYKILENMTLDERKEVFGEDPPEFKVNAFNFGVNEGAELGFSIQQEYNEESMTNYLKKVEEDIQEFMTGDSKEKNAATELCKEVKESYEKYKQGRLKGAFKGKGNWRADQAYALVAKMQTLADVTSEASERFSINAVNCASGKDRTGMSQSTSTNYFEKFHENVASAKEGEKPDITKTRYEKIQELDAEIKSSKDGAKKEKLTTEMKKFQKENLEFALKTNQLEIQEKNTGSKGHKLYGDSLPQFLTGNIRTKGGQTLQMQMLMYGLDKEGVEAQFTRTAKYNAT